MGGKGGEEKRKRGREGEWKGGRKGRNEVLKTRSFGLMEEFYKHSISDSR